MPIATLDLPGIEPAYKPPVIRLVARQSAEQVREQRSADLAASAATIAAGVRALLSGTTLDTLITNAHVNRAAARGARAAAYIGHRVVVRRRLGGGVQARTLAGVSRSWWTDLGRDHIGAELIRRLRKLEDLAKQSSETTKFMTLTYKTVEESWKAQNDMREMMNILRGRARKRGKSISYLWVAETQARLAVHFHVAIVGMQWVDWRILAQLWSHGMLRINSLKSSSQFAYLARYVGGSLDKHGVSPTSIQSLFSIHHLRRYGSSRDLSRNDQYSPAWARDAAEMAGFQIEECVWVEMREDDMVMICYPDGSEERFRWADVKWRARKASSSSGR